MAESAFSPTWRYNPIKHQLQFWFSPSQACAFDEALLQTLEKLALVPITFAEAVQAVAQGQVHAIGGWRNTKHESLLKLPMSTR